MGVNSEVPQTPVTEPAPKTFSEKLMANANDVREKTADTTLNSAHLMGVIEGTKEADSDGEKFDAAAVVAKADITQPTPDNSPVADTTPIEAPVEPGLGDTEQSLIELALSTQNGGINPGLVENAHVDAATVPASQPNTEPAGQPLPIVEKPPVKTSLSDMKSAIAESQIEHPVEPMQKPGWLKKLRQNVSDWLNTYT